MNRQHVFIAGAAILALTTGFGVAVWLQQPGQPKPAAASALLATQRTDLQNQPRTLNQYHGKVLVVNFWATWCPPCLEEIPHFIEIQQELGKKGVQFAGIALDHPRQVADFVQKFGINYPIFIAHIDESENMRSLGNHGGLLPYTLIYDRNGNLQEKILGGLDKTRLERLLIPLI